MKKKGLHPWKWKMPKSQYMKHKEPDADDKGGPSDDDSDDRIGADGKRTKKSVNYSKGHADAHCGICRHYLEPNACELVEGHIVPSYWCRLFEKAKVTGHSTRHMRK